MLKYSKMAVWRDKNGKIRCLGDSCPVECNDNCPIWINTVAMGLSRIGQYEKAIDEYKKALETAPDFTDAWNNMAVNLGTLGRYEEAYDAYKKAYELGGRANALYGLALSARDCGKTEEAISYCEEYKNRFGDGRLDDVENGLLREKFSELTESTTYMDMLSEFLKKGAEKGYVNHADTVPAIPELTGQADAVCAKIFKDLSAFIDEDPECDYDDMKKCSFVAAWCALAGIGAVALWDKDWPGLKKEGIVEKLSAPEGIDCLDDIALEAAGYSRTGKESDELRTFLVVIFCDEFDKLTDSDRSNSKAITDFLMGINKAMYLFGIAIGMHILGMD